MKRRAFFLAAAVLLLAGPVLAQTPPAATDAAGGVAPAPETLAPPGPGMVRVRLRTAKGVIVIDLNAAKAPITAANFLRYVDARRFDGATFYRASHPPGDVTYGVVQGGLRDHPEKLFKPIAHESTARTGLKHLDGTISMGRFAPGSATADFFICVGDSPYLDADPSRKGDNLGFAAFGQVVQGMELVKAMLAMPTDPNGGPSGMKGEILKTPVTVISARRAG
jgi:peptidyl-prolyl cis-trans isomerase A (cyclophilin A)